jgi:hypothetical protein
MRCWRRPRGEATTSGVSAAPAPAAVVAAEPEQQQHDEDDDECLAVHDSPCIRRLASGTRPAAGSIAWSVGPGEATVLYGSPERCIKPNVAEMHLPRMLGHLFYLQPWLWPLPALFVLWHGRILEPPRGRARWLLTRKGLWARGGTWWTLRTGIDLRRAADATRCSPAQMRPPPARPASSSTSRRRRPRRAVPQQA